MPSPQARPEEGLFVPEIARIVKAEDLTWQDRLIEVELPGGRDLGHQPGQFVQVGLFGFGEAPISICSSPKQRGTFNLCVRRLGGLTGALHRLAPGSPVGIRGPFGKGFPIDDMQGRDCLVVAGGIGLAPLRSVITTIVADRERYGRLFVFYGNRQAADMLFADELDEWAKDDRNDILRTVDEPSTGWTGNVGVVTTLFPKIKIESPKDLMVAMVGPPVMYRFVVLELQKLGVPDENMFLSLERRMKCGVGKCGHCQIDNRCVCTDGPVFSGPDVLRMHESI
jgi:NAD(P)H-flavin reductase